MVKVSTHLSIVLRRRRLLSVDMCRHLHNIHSLWPRAEQSSSSQPATQQQSASSLSSLSQLLASIYVSHAQKTRRPYHSWWCVIMTSEAQERKSRPTTYFLNQSALTNVGRKTTASVAVASHPSPSPVPACLPSSSIFSTLLLLTTDRHGHRKAVLFFFWLCCCCWLLLLVNG